MNLTNNRKRKTPVWLLKIQKRISARIQLFGGWLQNKVAAIPPGRMKSYLFLLVVFVFGCNSLIMMNVFRNPHSSMLERLRYPASIPLPTLRKLPPSIDKTEARFLKFIDSLEADSAGREELDQLRTEKPGLMDSVLQLKKSFLYQLN